MFIENIFKRATLQGISQYLLYGDIPETNDHPYSDRLADAYKKFVQSYKKQDCFKEDEEDLFTSLNELLSVHEQVYMEIGIQVGFSLSINTTNISLP